MKSRVSPSRNRGLSLVEMITVIAIIGILAAIAIPNVTNILGKSKDTIADNVVQTLAKATREFGHSQWDLALTGVADSSDEEFLILRTLQWEDDDPNGEFNIKGPFMRPDWNPAASNSTEDYRAQWTGTTWKLLEPGDTGAGLKIEFDASDITSSYKHPDDYTPVGAL